MSNNTENNLELTLERLYSNDANDRVKAAGELGEIGTPEIAPKLLEVAYEDEASTVRQMAIQSYSEILGEVSLDKIINAANDHYDDYVKLYAVMILGRIGGEKVIEPLKKYIASSDNKIQAAALRAMIHAETKNQGDDVFKILKEANQPIIIRNCIEALALWKYKNAMEYIENEIFANEQVNDVELKTISAFYLAVFGKKSGINYLENERVDSFMRISIEDTHYRGKDGLLSAASKL